MLSLTLAFSLFLWSVVCQTLIPDGSPLTTFALSARPYWKLSQAEGHDTCWPSFATNSSGAIVPAASLTEFPDAGGNCPTPMSSFPIYWVGEQCSDTETRIGYSLFFTKDGFSFLGTSWFGHAYDWERVIVIFAKDEVTNTWNRSYSLYSAHSGYTNYAWEDLKTSMEEDLDNLGTNLDHPTVFSDWAKHSMYDDINNSTISIIDEFDDNAFRNDHHKYYNSEDEMIELSEGNDLWILFENYDWESASSDPVVVYNKLCTASA